MQRQIEYVVAPDSKWLDVKIAFQERQVDCLYSVEESEIHVHENLVETEPILWPIHVLDVVCASIREPDPAFSHDSAMPQQSLWMGY